MSYEIEIGPRAEKVINKLHKDVALRIVNKLKQLKENPFRYLEHYEGDSGYKFRVGDIRLIIDIDFNKNILVVKALDKRSRIYKR